MIGTVAPDLRREILPGRSRHFMEMTFLKPLTLKKLHTHTESGASGKMIAGVA
jgi:hypothetical protein